MSRKLISKILSGKMVYSDKAIGKDQGQVAKAINRLIELGLIVKKGVQLSTQ